MQNHDTGFKARVLEIVTSIPQGKVMSYGQVAAYAGSPRAARQVGGILSRFDGSSNLPWWRVLNSAGHISIKGNMFCTPELQKQLLEGDGLTVSPDLTLDIEKYRYISQ